MSERAAPVRRRYGQHFLADPRILVRIAKALDIGSSDTVVEIGPGRGALTEHLRSRAGRLIAIEIDRDLAQTLRVRYADDSRVTIVGDDVLKVDLGALAAGPYLLAGNIPYNITTPILFHGLRRPRPARAVYLVQREVAERVVAAPASEAYGALSANVQAVARAEVLFTVSAGAFTPPPKVESAVLRIMPRDDPVIAADEEERFRSLVQGAFGMRRKQMGRVLRALWSLGAIEAKTLLDRAGVDPSARPEVLSPADFARVLRCRSS